MSSRTSGRRGRHRRRGRPVRAAEAAVPLAVGGTVAAVALLGPLTGAALRDGAGRPGSTASARGGADGADDPTRTALLSFPEAAEPDGQASPVPTTVPGSAGGGTPGSGGSTAGAASPSATGDRTAPSGATLDGSTGGSTGAATAAPTAEPTTEPASEPTSEAPSEPTDDPTSRPPLPSLPLPSVTLSLPGL